MEKEKEIGYYLHLLKVKKWLLIIPAILITIISIISGISFAINL